MLSAYTPLIAKYNELWQKHCEGKLEKGCLPMPKIDSQEKAVKCSLAVNAYLVAKAKDGDVRVEKLKECFQNGHSIEHSLMLVSAYLRRRDFNDILLASDFKQAMADIDNFELWFDYDSTEELFLEDETTEKSVSIYE